MNTPPPQSPPNLRTETPTGRLKTRELTLSVVATQVAGNVALSRGMHDMGSIAGVALLPYLHALANPWVVGGVVILTVWMLSDLALLSRADLSYVLPVTSISYVLIAIAGRFVLGERISGLRWVGIVVITLGVMLVGRTQTRTVPDVDEHEEPPLQLHHRHLPKVAGEKPQMRWLLVGIIILCNIFGDVLNTMGMKRHGEVEDLRPRHMVHLAVSVLRNPYVLGGLGCLALSFFALLALLSITNVSFAIPATASGYLLETLLAKYVLKERVHWRRWAGATLVAGGVLLIAIR